MKFIKSYIAIIGLGIFIFSNQACAPKKVVLQPAADVVEEKPKEVVVEEEPAEKVEPQPEPTPVDPPNYDFKNIQFEYDSHVLKTDSYAVLDQIGREMRKDLDAKFIVDGHASIEGTAEYNMKLSVDRANAVKMYLVNSGVEAANLTTNAYGATKPIVSNDTESGRAKNRRVEVKLSGQ